MARDLTRRDFVNGSLIGSGAALLTMLAPGINRASAPPVNQVGKDWYGYGGVGDFASSHGNTPEILNVAHGLRDGRFFDSTSKAADSGEACDLVIVGGGMAGLGAAYEFSLHRSVGQSCMILENHPVFGGEAKRNEFDVDGYRLIGPQGSNGFYMNSPGEISEDRYYMNELGIPSEFEYSEMPAKFAPLRFAHEHYEFLLWNEYEFSKGFFFDRESHGVPAQWHRDVWANQLRDVPLGDDEKRQLLHWRQFMDVPEKSDSMSAKLDNMTYRQFLGEYLGVGQSVSDYVSPILASAAGLGSDALSAYAASLLGMPGLWYGPPIDPQTRHSFPGGNEGFVRHFIRKLIPDALPGPATFENIMSAPIDFSVLDKKDNPVRMRLGSHVIDIRHSGRIENSDGVDVIYVRDGKQVRIRAKAVVMASGGWINKHVIADLPDSYRQAYDEFVHAPMLVANVAVTNWRFMYKLGITAAQWQEGFGFAVNIRRPMNVGDYRPPLDPDKPTVLSFYVPFDRPGMSAVQQAIAGRAALLSTSYAQYEKQIRDQMTRLFGASGFDADRDIAGIILNRWGHAYVAPTPGFFYRSDGSPGYSREIAEKPHGRIAFGHGELRGFQHWGPAADQGAKAVRQIRDALSD